MAVPVAHVVFILDDSGSMRPFAEPTVKAFNAYVETLKKTKGAEIRFSAYPLDGTNPYQSNVPIQDALTLTYGMTGSGYDNGNYRPTRSRTPLFSTVYDVIGQVEASLKKFGPRKVVVCIQTDGIDPMGSTYVKTRVLAKQAEGWEFIFMGTYNESATRNVSKDLGIPAANYMFYSGALSVAAFSAAGWNVSAYTSGRAANAGFSEAQRKQAKG